jgi:imidazoleglycerol phosphate dehydratase HisB
MARKGKVERKTKETDIQVELELEGTGKAEVDTGMPFLNHMLDSFSRHAWVLRSQVKG